MSACRTDPPSFSDLIAPVTLETFYRRYWERETLFLPHNDPKKFADLLSIADVDDYITRSDLRAPALRLVKSGGQIPVGSYTTSFSLGGQRYSDLIRSDRVIASYREGATILIQLAHWSLPSLQPFAAQLQKFFGFNVELNVYLTPPNSQGFSAHFDTHSVFVLQLAGSKTWELRGDRPIQPLLDDRFNEAIDRPGDVVEELTLNPGSFLYVPRGRFHSAKANTEPSLHVTVGLFPPTWLDIFEQRLNQLRDDSRFRRAPSPYEVSKLAELSETFVEKFDLTSVRDSITAHQQSIEGQPSKGRLLDTISLSTITLQTMMRVRHEANLSVLTRENEIVVRGIGAEVLLPKRAESFVSCIMKTTGIFRLKDLNSVLDEASILVVAKALVREGVIALPQPGHEQN